MRTHHAIAGATVILAGLGLKLTFFSAPIAAADVGAVTSVRIDVSAMQRTIGKLPVQTFDDMTVVFSSGG